MPVHIVVIFDIMSFGYLQFSFNIIFDISLFYTYLVIVMAQSTLTWNTKYTNPSTVHPSDIRCLKHYRKPQDMHLLNILHVLMGDQAIETI